MNQDFSNKSIPGLLPTNQFQVKTVVNLERNEPLNFTNSHTQQANTETLDEDFLQLLLVKPFLMKLLETPAQVAGSS